MDELTKKLEAKLNFSNTQLTSTIADLLGFIKLVIIPNKLKVVAADPDDNKVLECAEIGGATHIVTGDRRHLLPIGQYQGISIVTAADFLKLLSSYS